MTLEQAFALTPEERSRLDAAPFKADETAWAQFAAAVLEQILTGYADGEVDLRKTLELVRSCSLGCALSVRVSLMAYAVEETLRITPKARRKRRPPYPAWLKRSASTLVQVIAEQHPEKPVAPHHHNDWTTDVLETAVGWLVALGFVDARTPVTPRTVYEWCRPRKRPGSPATPPFST